MSGLPPARRGHMDLERWTVIYDGDCALCTRAVAFLRAWDTASRLAFVTSREAQRRADLPPLSPSALDQAMHLVSPSGTVTAGAETLSPLLRLLPWGRPLAAALRLPGSNRLARTVYNWVARNRHRLPGGTPRCTTGAADP